ncbi:MAG: type III-B CRISPR module RAMP protein Cmr1 [Candidatus Electrothrix communis]|nr:MAG: type III-B CRISPR module RAMP protein Cmr1 [Candidatus Electrothrix communis]
MKSLGEQARSAEQGKWHSYKIEVITPIFGGGVKAGEPDTQMPIRASAIRGQLRYWWRFLATNRRVAPLSGEALFKAERDIWGGMAEEGEDYSSKVKLRIHIDPDVPIEIKPCATRHSRRVKNKWTEEYEEKIHVNYDKAVPEYAMFPGRGELPDEATGKKDKPPSDMIFRLSFILLISIEKDKNGKKKISFKDEVEPALQWWASFGGIGARTRRGVGAIKVTDIEEKDNDKKILTVSEDSIKKHKCEREVLPVKDNATDVWKECIIILQKFRQLSREKGEWAGVGRKENKTNKKKPSTSNWPEPNAIRKTTGKYLARHKPKPDASILFPRAMFGMPIGFPFISDRNTPPDTELLPVKGEKLYDRLASSLILKPVATADGKYQPTALLMPYCHLCNLELRLQYQNKKSAKPGEKSEWTFGPDKWSKLSHDNLKLALPLEDNNSTDALTAFMNFFAKGGA